MARIVLVDDSLTMRVGAKRILSEAGHEIVGEARDGRQGIEVVCATDPDLVLMDLNMPGMGGIEATREIMNRAPTCILILSSVAGAGQPETVEALRAGAVDFLTKPDAQAAFGRDLLAKVEGILAVATHAHPNPSASDAPIGATRRTLRPVDVVAIGVSTGGPRTLSKILGLLPAERGPPILVAQHMARGWTQPLASQLDSECQWRVKEAEEGERIELGTVYIAPGGQDLTLTRRFRAKIAEAPPGGAHPSVTTLFESVAAVAGSRALGVVLTGMGNDGLEGVRAMKKAGAIVVAQDAATSVIHGMPRVIAQAGLADEILSEDEIAAYLGSLKAEPRPAV